MKQADTPLSRPRRVFRRILLTLAVACLAVGIALIDGFLIEPHWVKVTRYEVRMPGLPSKLDGFKVVQLSDIHRCDFVPDDAIRSAVAKANSLSPDVAVLTGDFVNQGSQHVAPCADMLAKLEARLGTYAVLGNHDYWNDSSTVKRELKSKGIEVLINRNTEIADGLVLLGLDDYWVGGPDMKKTWKGVDQSKAHILLSHSPLAIEELRGRKCLMLSGHTHGGQVNIPPIPRRKLPGLRGWKYIRGWYREGETLIYINSGIGMIRPAARFLCRPEVTLFTLRSVDRGNSSSIEVL